MQVCLAFRTPYALNMSKTHPKIRQPLPLLHPPLHPLLPRNHTIPIPIKDINHNPHDILLLAIIDLLGRLVVQAVRAPDIPPGPDAVVLVVVQGEEGGGVEVRDVVFFC